MRSVWMVAFKGIFKRKSYTIAIFFLTLVAAVCLATGLSTIFRTQAIYNTAYQKAHSPDLYYIYQQENYSDAYLDFFHQRKEVEDAFAQPILLGTGTAVTLDGHDLSSNVFMEYDTSENVFALADGAGRLTDQSVYAPLIYQSQYNAKTGDSLRVRTADGGNVGYTIAGFFEDPVYGSSFMGMKRILMTAGGYDELKSLTSGSTTAPCTVLNVYLKPEYQGGTLSKTAQKINRAFGKDTLANWQTDRTIFPSAVLIIPRILSVVMLCFSALLLVVVILVLRHAILSSIEADYVSLGVFKAIGFTGRDILVSILLQYMLVVACGAAAGVAAAVFATPAMAGVLMASTGILGTAGLTLPAALGVPLALLLLCGGIAALTARRSAHVSPMRAIAFGKAPVQFSSRLNPPLARLRGLPLWFALPVKQMATRLRQYVTLVAVAALFTFMLSTLQMLTSSFGSIDKMARLLGQPLYDVDVASVNTALCPPAKLDEIVRDIEATYAVKRVDWSTETSVRADGNTLSAVLLSNFAQQKDAMLEGKLPAFSNEMAITPVVSRMLGKSVGDSVVLQKGDVQQTYRITCVVQTISEMGKVVELGGAAYQRLEPGFQPMGRSIVLKDNRDVDGVVNALKKKYPEESGAVFTDSKTVWYNIFSSVQTATALASALVMLLTLLLIACVTLLLCAITLYRETIDTGIFKAIGFRTMGLRLQFMLRFALVSAIGGVIGTVLSLLFANPLVSGALSSIGVASVPSSWGFATLGFPILFVVCAAGLTAFFGSARIRRLSPASLVNE